LNVLELSNLTRFLV